MDSEPSNVTKFDGISVSSKIGICGLPVRVDSYQTCTFGCKYCFSENRRKKGWEKRKFSIANVDKIKKQMNTIHNEHIIREDNLLDVLLSKKVTWHHGGMSDPFQPCEKEYNITKDIIEISKEYNQSILFSTKSDSYYNCEPTPELHSFSLSVSNLHNPEIEPNVPTIENRYKFYTKLKDEGFKVGVRIQPFIPNITTSDIIDMFSDADHISIEGLKVIGQSEPSLAFAQSMGLTKKDFVGMGLLNLNPELRLELYQPLISKIEEYGIPYSLADNDLHYKGTNMCCCGDRLVQNTLGIDNTALFHKFGSYTKEQMDIEIINSGCANCNIKRYLYSDCLNGADNLKQFLDTRYDNKRSPSSPKFQYYTK